MTTVVDLGSVTHGNEESLVKLTARFRPDIYWAFDPLGRNEERETNGCLYRHVASAAWTRGGLISLGVGADGMNATVVADKSTRGEWGRAMPVPCFNFPAWLSRRHAPVDVLKMDIEGAEYPILERMVRDELDRKVGLLLIEWHDHLAVDYTPRRLALLDALRCPVEGW